MDGPGGEAVWVFGSTAMTLALLLSAPLGTAVGFQLRVGILLAFALAAWGPVAFRSSAYWSSRLTKGLWLVRGLFLFGFLAYQLQTSTLDFRSLVGLGSFLAASFAYEFGFWLHQGAFVATTIRGVALGTAAAASIMLTVLGPTLLASGAHGVFLRVEQVREWVPMWPNHWGAFLAILALAAFSSRAWQSKTSLLLVCAAITLTLSRTAISILAALFVFYLLLVPNASRQIGKLASFGIVILLLGIVGFVVLGKQDVGQVEGSNTADASFGGRWDRWETALEAWSQSPWIGYGFKPFTEIAPTFQTNGQIAAVGSSHNDIIDLVSRTGLVASVPFLVWIGLALWIGWKRTRAKGPDGAAAPATIALAGVMLATMFLNPLKQGEILLVFWMAGGILASLDQEAVASARADGRSVR